MTEEEIESIEKSFEHDLKNLSERITGTATEIVALQRPLIMTFKYLMERIAKKDFIINEQSKMIELMAEMIDNYDSQLNICSFKNKEGVKRVVFEQIKKGVNNDN